ALLATGAFLIAAIGVFRLDANQDAFKAGSGTGGFALIGQSTLPIVQNLNTAEGRPAFALNPETLQSTHIVPFRVHDGDEASCLNLDKAQKPRLLGVKPELLAGRFTFARTEGRARSSKDMVEGVPAGGPNHWNLLNPSSSPAATAEIPAIA